MNSEDFRRLALEMPGAVEQQHNGHPDFRVGGRIFATMGYPNLDCAMVKLRPEQQQKATFEAPEIFAPANGAWGKQGSTLVRLDRADESAARVALALARTNVQN